MTRMTSTRGGRNPAIVARFALDVTMVAVFAAAGFVALSWPIRGAVLPLTASGIGLVLSAINLVRDVVRVRAEGFSFIAEERGSGVTEASDAEEGEEEDGGAGSGDGSEARDEAQEFRDGLRYATILLVLLAAIYVAGVLVVAPLFVGLFLWREARMRPPFAALGAVGVLVLLLILESALGLRLPDSLLGF